MSGRKVFLLGGVVLLTLAFGCSLLPRENDSESDGWYIKLQIRAPASASAKGITVSEFEVTGMNIKVLDPAGGVLGEFDWVPPDSQEYLVAVPELGEYRLEVTHFGEREGQSVQATESATFEIRAMKITVIDIIPGCIGLINIEPGELEPSILGYWNWFRAYAKYTGVMQLTPDGAWASWEDYAGTEPGGTGTWSQSGDAVTFVVDGVPLSGTALWVNENQLQLSIPGLPTPMVWYRKGSEPDGYLFNNPNYPPIALSKGTPTPGNLPGDGLIIYRYVAGAEAQHTVISWQDRINSADYAADLELWVYQNEETLAYPWRATESPIEVALTPGQAYDIVVANQPLNSGSFSIKVEEGLPDCAGIWFGSNVETPGEPVDAWITLTVAGTYETLLHEVGGSTILPMSQRGTYACAGNVLAAASTETYDGATWVPEVVTWTVSYSISGNTLTLYQDFDQNGLVDATWTLVRQ
jgi:hypothetical protein